MIATKICDNCGKKIDPKLIWNNEDFYKLALCGNCDSEEYLAEKIALITSLRNSQIDLENLSKEEIIAQEMLHAIDEFAKGKTTDLSKFSDLDNLDDLTFEEAQLLLNSDEDFVKEQNLIKQQQIEKEARILNETLDQSLKDQRINNKINKKNQKKDDKKMKRELKNKKWNLVVSNYDSFDDAMKFLEKEGIKKEPIKKEKTDDFDIEFDLSDFEDDN